MCFEREKRFIDAIGYYKTVNKISQRLNPESRYRELMCLITICSFSEALKICNSFDEPSPEEFPVQRYLELRNLVNKEKKLLDACLSGGRYYAGC